MQLAHVLATFLLTAGSVLAQPPACLLAALNTQANPADVKGICQSKASDIQRTIQSACGSDTSAALASFADTCKGQGVTVPAVSASSSNRGSNSTTNGTFTGTITTNGTTNLTTGSSSNSKNGGGQLKTGLLSVAVAGMVGSATFML